MKIFLTFAGLYLAAFVVWVTVAAHRLRRPPQGQHQAQADEPLTAAESDWSLITAVPELRNLPRPDALAFARTAREIHNLQVVSR